jgi:amino acid transporter
MKNFDKAVKDIDFNFHNIIIFTNILNAVVILLLCSLVLTLFRYNMLYAVVPAVLYFIVSTIFKLRKKYYLDIEKEFPFLDEKLRTAVDHKILSSILMSFLIVFLAVNNIYFDFSQLIDNLNGNNKPTEYTSLTGNDSGDEEGTMMDVRAAGGITAEDIYGEEMIAQLGGKELDLVIKPSSYEVNLDDVEDAERVEFQNVFPDEIFSSSAESYQENIPKEQQELVKSYFEKITQ